MLDQYPSLMPMGLRGKRDVAPTPYANLDEMWETLIDSRGTNTAAAVRGAKYFRNAPAAPDGAFAS